MDDIKKAVIGVITLAITTGGGLIMNKVLGTEEASEPAAVEQATMPTIVINNESAAPATKDTVVKKVYVKPKPKKTETEKRKESGLDW